MLTIKTETLKQMLSKATKAVVNNKLLPLTSLLSIEYSNKKLVLRTFDGYNHLFVGKEVESDIDNFYAVVDANLFTSLVNKTTKENIQLSLEDKFLKVKGNGSYKFDLAIDGNKIISFPVIDVDFENTYDSVKVDVADLKLALDINKPSVATTYQVVSMTGCYFGDYIITTNGLLATITNKKVFKNNLLLNYSTLNLITALKDEKVEVAFSNDYIMLVDSEVTIYGKVMPEVEDYPAPQVLSFLDIEFGDVVKLNKNELMNVLDRLNIFINVYDSNTIKLSFSGDKLTLNSLSSSGVESIKYIDKMQPALDFECYIKYSLLKTQLQTTKKDTIDIFYGSDNAIMIEDEIACYVVALCEEF